MLVPNVPSLTPTHTLVLLALMAFTPLPLLAQVPGEEYVNVIMALEGVEPPKNLPDRGDEGSGPFSRLLIKEVIIIDGTGQPAYGPASVLIEQDRIVDIVTAVDHERYQEINQPNVDTKIIDGRGHYLLPGFIDAHAHFGSTISAHFGAFNDPEYIAKLWLGHGITSIRDVGALWGLDWTVRHKQRSAANRITAPRIFAYPVFPGMNSLEFPGQFPVIDTATNARQWVREVHKKGADGIKFVLNEFPVTPSLYRATVNAAKELGMEVATHYVSRDITVLDSAQLGVDSMEHIGSMGEALWRGHFSAEVPGDYIADRPKHTPASVWDYAYGPRSPQWLAAVEQLVSMDHTLVPTLAVTEAMRDVMRAERAEWHHEYAVPSLTQAFQPNPKVHGSFFFDWTSQHEIAIKREYQTSMQFLYDFHTAGGRIAAGSDGGYIYQLYGFAFIRELELLQEAGLHPLQVIKAATLNGAVLLNHEADLGSIAVGKKADLVLLAENPLVNLKVLYGTGHQRYNPDTAQLERVGGVSYTIKDGIVWDAKQLLAEVRQLVVAEKAKGVAH